MPLPSSGALSISDIVAEFGGSAPHSLSEYYRNGSFVGNNSDNQNIPTSGAISIKDFYGAAALPQVTFTPATGDFSKTVVATQLITSGTSFSPNRNGEACIIAVGGGSSGDAVRVNDGGSSIYLNYLGGGAGGAAGSLFNALTSMTFTISIGAGGAGYSSGTGTPPNPQPGGATTVSGNQISLTANGALNNGSSTSAFVPTVPANAGPRTGGTASGGNLFNIQGGDGCGIIQNGSFGVPNGGVGHIGNGDFGTRPWSGGDLNAITGTAGTAGVFPNSATAGTGFACGSQGGGASRDGEPASVTIAAGQPGCVYVVYFT
jgi:hypothetical protein